MFSSFQDNARKNKIPELLIARIKGLATMAGVDIQTCKTEDPRVHELKSFLKKYPENLLLQVDKSPDLIYVKRADYFEKIQHFLGPNFQKIENYSGNELEKDLKAYRTLLNKTFENSLPKDVLTDVHPPYSISDLYGLYKCHKDDEPIRGIVTSYNSIVCNAEDFLKKILEPIVAECNFAVDSLANFKEKFILDKVKFNESEHKVVSVDIVNMYNNVNVPRVISYILDKIYTEPRKYLKYKNENGFFCHYPLEKI